MKVKAIDADVISHGVLIYFEDGTAALFDAEFLHRHRDSCGNTIVTEVEDLEPPAPEGAKVSAGRAQERNAAKTWVEGLATCFPSAGSRAIRRFRDSYETDALASTTGVASIEQ